MHDGHNAMTIAYWPSASGAKNQDFFGKGLTSRTCYQESKFHIHTGKGSFLKIDNGHCKMIFSVQNFSFSIKNYVRKQSVAGKKVDAYTFSAKGNARKTWKPAISPFPTMFSNLLFFYQTWPFQTALIKRAP